MRNFHYKGNGYEMKVVFSLNYVQMEEIFLHANISPLNFKLYKLGLLLSHDTFPWWLL